MFSLLRTGTLLAVLAAPPGLAAPAPFEARGEAPDLFALRVGRAETVSEGTIPFAVVLVEDGEITAIGQDLPIERGIPVYDLPDAVVTPGFVNCKSRLGLDGRGPNGVRPDVTTALELYPGAGTYGQVLEHGVTTLGLYPAGSGVPGQAVAVRPQGATVEAMVVRDSAYLLMYCGANKQAKKYVMDAFELVDDYMEKVEKEREKFEKKSKKSKSKKKKDDEEEDEDDEKDDKKSSKDDDDEFQPPVPDEKTLPMLRLVTGDLRALIGIRKAADYLHLLDAIDGREFEWDLAIDLRDELDLFYIADQLGEQGVRMVVDPRITLHPGTRRERNLPRRAARGGRQDRLRADARFGRRARGLARRGRRAHPLRLPGRRGPASDDLRASGRARCRGGARQPRGRQARQPPGLGR